MNRIAIDTNIYSAFKRNDPGVTRVLRKVEYIGVSVVVLGELMGGFKCGSKAEKNMTELSQFLDTPRVFVLTTDQETAEFYSEIYQDLRKRGNPVPSNDIWIAASAMRNGLALFSLDEHFKKISGIIRKNLSEE